MRGRGTDLAEASSRVQALALARVPCARGGDTHSCESCGRDMPPLKDVVACVDGSGRLETRPWCQAAIRKPPHLFFVLRSCYASSPPDIAHDFDHRVVSVPALFGWLSCASLSAREECQRPRSMAPAHPLHSFHTIPHYPIHTYIHPTQTPSARGSCQFFSAPPRPTLKPAAVPRPLDEEPGDVSQQQNQQHQDTTPQQLPPTLDKTTMASVRVDAFPFTSPPCSPRGGFAGGGPISPKNMNDLVVEAENPSSSVSAASMMMRMANFDLVSTPDEGRAAIVAAAAAAGAASAVAASVEEVATLLGGKEEKGALAHVARAAKVYCHGELLHVVQTAGIFEDSKEFVDMPMRVDPEVVLEQFHALPPSLRRDPTVLRAFLARYFSDPGSDLVPHIPTDHTDSPSLLEGLAGHAAYQRWASELNDFWKQLCRKVSPDVDLNPQRYSILRRTHPVVIPGGRFRESYYWDSYWIVLGLLACDMKETARGLVQNLLDDVANFGFVPNGGRIYYLNRSQPPLLSEMVMTLLEADEAVMKGKLKVRNCQLFTPAVCGFILSFFYFYF